MSTKFAALKIVTVCTILLSTLGVAGRSISKTSWPLQERKTKEAKAPLNQEIELKPNDDRYPEIGRPELLKISADRLLVTVNDTLYLLNSKKEVVWENTIINMVDTPIVDSRGRVYGIAADVKQFVVDEVTGDVSYFGPKYGGTHSYYTQIQPYRTGQHLVVENMQHYRENNACYPKCPYATDRIEAWEGESLLWSTTFPPNAELHVWGDRILALSRKKSSVVIQEIEAPKNKENGNHR